MSIDRVRWLFDKGYRGAWTSLNKAHYFVLTSFKDGERASSVEISKNSPEEEKSAYHKYFENIPSGTIVELAFLDINRRTLDRIDARRIESD